VSDAGSPLPGSYRWALVAAVILGFQVALAAAFDVEGAFNYDAPPQLGGSEAAFPGLGLSPLAQRELVLAAASGQRSALEAMFPWRAASSLLLAVAAGVVFILGMRLRVSQESRPSTAHQLGTAALAAAVLRSVDGAQNLVLMRTMLGEVGKAIVKEGVVDGGLVASVATTVFSVASAGWTFAVVAVFMTLGNYFRSETLRAALGRAEP
jgi:hypothetical protein